ncbi:hypothetical protein PAMP_009835 [Pampus punctatissimus]
MAHMPLYLSRSPSLHPPLSAVLIHFSLFLSPAAYWTGVSSAPQWLNASA